MKYVLYGLPCAGKTTLMSELDIPTVNGSAELNRMASGRFFNLPESDKKVLRIKYVKQLAERNDTFISDGHYSFLNDVVFTEADGKVYDVFLYLYCKPAIIAERLKKSNKNSRYASLSVERIRKWQAFEIDNLRNECHKRNKDFYVVRDIDSADFQRFIDKIENGYSSYGIASGITEKIISFYPQPCELHISDGDKTIIEQDSFRISTNNYITHVFDDNCYTGYQSMLFSEETSSMNYDIEKLSEIRLNRAIYEKIADKNYVVLSSGVTKLWEKLSDQFALKHVIASTSISADTKYYVVKLLQEKGYSVTAYGDGKNDYFMLRQANKGYLCIGSYYSRSLRTTDVSGISLIYDKAPFILADTNDLVSDDISVCKSNSGINGSKLAYAHFRLGHELGKIMHENIPSVNSAVIVLERGGRFFGDGLYAGFGGVFFSYDPKEKEMPAVYNSIVVIVDSVINTGKSILETIDKLKKINPDAEIIIAANVIQEKTFELLRDYKVFAVRKSANSFVGSSVSIQKDGKGPDTAERLFNYID